MYGVDTSTLLSILARLLLPKTGRDTGCRDLPVSGLGDPEAWVRSDRNRKVGKRTDDTLTNKALD